MITTAQTILLGAATFALAIGSGWRKLYEARSRTAALLKQGLVFPEYCPLWMSTNSSKPVAPEWSWLTGNLLLVNKMYQFVPAKATKVSLFTEIVSRFTTTGCCYIDLWPVGAPFLLIMSPSLAAQATQEIQEIAESRPAELQNFFKPLCGGVNLFDLPAAQWKPWRAVFNKGFGPDTIFILLPEMISQSVKYRDILVGYAQRGEIFQLDRVTLRFAMDFIGCAALNAPMTTQDGYDELGDSMSSQVQWLPTIPGPNPFDNVDIPRIFMNWWNGRKMDHYIGGHLDKRYKELVESDLRTASKSILDLVLKAYLVDSKTKGQPESTSTTMNPEFRTFSIRQIRLFLFAGHDSVSSTICYAMHLLSTNPSCLQRIRQEHDTVFGESKSRSHLPEMLTADPTLLNRIPYTTGVLKETLRIFPPASGIRSGAPGKYLTGEDGTRYPTAGHMIWILHAAMHSSPVYWTQPEAFLPHRWLAKPGDPLYPPKNGWRPFERGPRDCIGQSLALAELKIVLVMLCRTFDFVPGYAEWDEKRGIGGLQEYRGERAYQIAEGSAHPAEHYPCRVSLTAQAREYL